MNRYLIIISVFFIWFTYNVYGQFQVLDEPKYDEIVENLDYSKTKKKLRLKEFTFDKTEEENEVKLDSGALRAFAGLIRLFALVCIAALIGFILYKLFMLIETTDKSIELSETSEVEQIEEIKEEDLLQKALDEGDYRTAIRMKFILILQEYNKTGLIKWKEEKTNRDYLNELRQTNKYAFFREASSIYNLIWYGNHGITKEDYDNLAPKLELS